MDDFLKIRFALDNVHQPELGEKCSEGLRPAPRRGSAVRRLPRWNQVLGGLPSRHDGWGHALHPDEPLRLQVAEGIWARAALHLAVVNAGDPVWPVDELRASSSGRW